MRDLIKSILKSQVNYIYQVTFMYYFINISGEELLWRNNISFRWLRWVFSLLSFICHLFIMVTLWGTAEVKGLLCLRLHKHERKEWWTWWTFRNLEKKIKNVNKLSGFVHAELLVLVFCVAPAGWWLQGVGHHVPGRGSVPLLGCEAAGDPALFPAGLVWLPWEHCLDGTIPTGTAGCCSCRSSQGVFPRSCCTIGAITESFH